MVLIKTTIWKKFLNAMVKARISVFSKQVLNNIKIIINHENKDAKRDNIFSALIIA